MLEFRRPVKASHALAISESYGWMQKSFCIKVGPCSLVPRVVASTSRG